MYIELGFEHILDLNGFDHVLFLLCLVAVYQSHQWFKVIKLLTAFTIGHSVSLALSVLNIIHFSIELIEFIIPITIILTAVINLYKSKQSARYFYLAEYLLTTVFGIIHGLGFSILLKSLLESESSLISSLFAFNIGLELGQIIIVIIILSIGYIFIHFLKISPKKWAYLLSILSLLISVYLAFERWPF